MFPAHCSICSRLLITTEYVGGFSISCETDDFSIWFPRINRTSDNVPYIRYEIQRGDIAMTQVYYPEKCIVSVSYMKLSLQSKEDFIKSTKCEIAFYSLEEFFDCFQQQSASLLFV